MKTMTTLFTIILLMVTVMSCQRQNEENSPDLKNLPEKSAQLISADNQFGLELFRKIESKASSNDNTMISPLSVSLALAMTYNGAVGETKTEMEKTLKLYGLTTGQINNAYQSLVAALQSADPDVLLEIADAIYYRKEVNVKPDFVTVNKTFYDAAVAPLDFNNSASALKTINGWVADKTRDKIPTIIDQIDPQLVMILLNAIYFNGKWKSKFGDSNTHSLPFTFGDGTRKEVAQMNQESDFEYASNDLFSAVNLPYGKGDYRMTVILPNSNKTTSDVLAKLDNDNWSSWMKSFELKNHVVVTMPRFKFSWQMKLNDILSEMGMKKAFIPSVADFTGIADLDLFISYVIHKTFIDVNENGTEAAAVTAVGVFVTSIPGNEPQKIYFTVDRPFIFAISEKNTGSILFIGEMNAPEYQP